VEVAVILDSDLVHPLWTEHISPIGSKMVFSVRRVLLRGQVIRFVVFAGQETADQSRDAVTLEATINR